MFFLPQAVGRPPPIGFPIWSTQMEQGGAFSSKRTLFKIDVMSKTGRRSSPQTGKWETKEIGASQGRKNRSAVDPAPEKGMEQVDQAERRSCLAER